jgi:hypothetical protein
MVAKFIVSQASSGFTVTRHQNMIAAAWQLMAGSPAGVISITAQDVVPRETITRTG